MQICAQCDEYALLYVTQENFREGLGGNLLCQNNPVTYAVLLNVGEFGIFFCLFVGIFFLGIACFSLF